jgi:hypothetical protein
MVGNVNQWRAVGKFWAITAGIVGTGALIVWGMASIPFWLGGVITLSTLGTLVSMAVYDLAEE